MTTDTTLKRNTNIALNNRQPTPQDLNSTHFEDDAQSIPPEILVGRQEELDQVVECLVNDEDFWLIGAPGNGRRVLVYKAAKVIRAKVLEIDCMKATSSGQLLQLMCQSLNHEASRDSNVQEFIQNMGVEVYAESFSIQTVPSSRSQLEPAPSIMNESEPEFRQNKQKEAFERLIDLLQQLAVSLDTRIVILFHSFEHIYSWDRQRTSKSQGKTHCERQWEVLLRKEIAEKNRVSYVLIGTGNPKKVQNKENSAKIIALRPLDNNVLKGWVREFIVQYDDKLTFSPDGKSLEEFLQAVNGHFGNARALAKRLILNCQLNNQSQGQDKYTIELKQVQKAINDFLKDLSSVFESLLLSLPDSQLQLIECLALEPTSNPHRQEYIEKHSLMKGGTLQGALKGLSEKGLIYDAQKDKYDYQLTFPLMALWIRRRVT